MQAARPADHVILGIDEVGRGAWAGPLVVGAVILTDANDPKWEKLTDSKQLTPHQREVFAQLIWQDAAAAALGWVSAREIDRIGLAAALRLATRRAVKDVLAEKVKFDEIILDGTSNYLVGTPLAERVTNIPKADFLVKSVSAASVIAKVARDEHMHELAKVYPAYGFEGHVGYGATTHRDAILQHGLSPEHRRCFRPVGEYAAAHPTPDDAGRLDHIKLKNKPREIPLPENVANGRRAEAAAAQYLQGQGQEVIALNYRTRYAEIDLISLDQVAKKIYFTEVKYRKGADFGDPLEMVDAAKHERMRAAAEAFLQYQPRLAERYDPELAVACVSGPEFAVQEWWTLDD